MRRRRGQSMLLGVLLIGAVSVLSACTVPIPDADPTPTATPQDESSELPDEGEAIVEAVIVVAGIDTDGNNVSASGYVSGVVEEGGECLFVFESVASDATVSVSRTAVADVRSSSCGLAQAPSTEFVRGTWTVELRYTSPTTDVVSLPVELEIP